METCHKCEVLWRNRKPPKPIEVLISVSNCRRCIYQGAAPEATLLGALSLQREASGSPLQKDVAKAAAKYMKKNYVHVLQAANKVVPAITEK